MVSWQTKLTLLLVSTMTIMSGTAVVASLPMIKEHFRDVAHVDLYSKLILTAPAIAIAFFAPWTGKLASYFGKKQTLVVALGLFSLFGMMGAWAQSIEGIILSRLLFGVCVAVLMSISLALVGDYMHLSERVKYLGYQNTFVALGGVLFMAGGGYLSEYSWQGAFYIYATGLVVMVMALLFLYEPSQTVQGHEGPELSLGGFWRLWPVFGTAVLTLSVFYMVPTQLPYLLHDSYQMEGRAVGMLMATVTFVSAIVSLFYRFLRKHWSVAKVYTFLFCVQGSGFVSLSLAHTYLQFSMALMLVGVGVGLAIVNTNSWLLETARDHERLRATGWLTGSIFLGQFLSPLLLHLPVSMWGVSRAFFLVGLLLLSVSVVILYRLMRR